MPESNKSFFTPLTSMILGWIVTIIAFTIGGILFSQNKKESSCLQKFIPVFMMFLGSAALVYSLARTYEYYTSVTCETVGVSAAKSYMSDEKMNSMINSFMNSSMGGEKSYVSDSGMSKMVDSFMKGDSSMDSILGGSSMASGGESMVSGGDSSMIDSFMKSSMSESGMCGYTPSSLSMSDDSSAVYF